MNIEIPKTDIHPIQVELDPVEITASTAKSLAEATWELTEKSATIELVCRLLDDYCSTHLDDEPNKAAFIRNCVENIQCQCSSITGRAMYVANTLDDSLRTAVMFQLKEVQK